MNRTQTKCFALSLLAHGLVVVVLFCAMAFRPAPPPEEGEEIEVIDLSKVDRITDAPSSGGGDPAPAAPAPKVNPPPAPQPEPPAPEIKLPSLPKPEPVQPKVQEPAPKPEPDPPVKTPDDNWSDKLKPVKELKPKPEKAPEKITLKPVNPKTAKAAKEAEKAAEKEAEEEAAAARRENQRRAEETAKAREAYKDGINKWASTAVTRDGGIRGQLSKPGESVSIGGGAGGSGPLSANWRAVVKRIYENNFNPPENKRNLRTKVSVTVQRNGKVVGDEILQPSGDREFDRAVREALSLVRKLPEFPDGTSDLTRTITLDFIPPSQRHLE